MKQRRIPLRACLALAVATIVWLPCVHLLFARATTKTTAWREHTTFLTGTPTTAGTGLHMSAAFGTIYLAAYFGFVLLTPILLLAAGFLLVWQRFTRTSKTYSGT